MIELALSLADIALAAALLGGLALLAHGWHRLAVESESGRAALLERSLRRTAARLAAARERAEKAERKAARANALASRLRVAEDMIDHQAERIARLDAEASRYAVLVRETIHEFDLTDDAWVLITQADVNRKAMEVITLADVRDCAAYGREALAEIAKAMNVKPVESENRDGERKGKRPGGR